MRRLLSTTVIPEGNAGVLVTVDRMVGLVREGEEDPLATVMGESIIAVVKSIFLNARAERWHTFEEALYGTVTELMRHEEDPPEVQDQIKSPAAMLGEIAQNGGTSGDCDDYAILFAFLYRLLGQATRFRVVSQQEDGAFDHVVCEILRVSGDWIPLEDWIPLDPVTAEVLRGDRRLGFNFMVPEAEITFSQIVYL